MSTIRSTDRRSGEQRGGFVGEPATTAQWTGVTTLSDARDWQLNALKQLKEVQALPANWDGYGSPVLSELAYRHACHLVFSVEVEQLPVPHIGPESGGAVQMEWSNGRRELELHFLHDGTVSFLKVEGGDDVEDKELPPGAIDEWRSLVEWLQED